MKRKENMCSFPCQCTGVTFCLQKGAEMLEKPWRPGTSFPQTTLCPSRAAGLLSQPRLPAALWHDRVLAWQTSLASSPPTALTDINFAQCRQSVGCFSPAATSPFITPSCPIFLVFLASQYFFITKRKVYVYLWAARKGLLVSTFFVVSNT